jgi:2-iminoacetate synthase
MSFYPILNQYSDAKIDHTMTSVSGTDVERALAKDYPGADDFLALLSPAAGVYLEQMARLSQDLTLRHFGRTLQLYTPLYLSDYCENRCTYCSFSALNPFPRRKLSPDEVDREGAIIAATGLRHLLILTGESLKQSPVGYIGDCVAVLKKYFHSIAIEIYPLTAAEYAELIERGVDGLTLYQETYDESVYREIHPAGPKRDYRFRLEAPERAATSHMRQINIGALLGLADWRKEVFALGRHARYLMDRFPDADIGVSVPRLRPHKGAFVRACGMTDSHLVQAILSLRLFLPRLGISLSTRETETFRDHLIPLGITRLSAGSVTSVGGHGHQASAEDASPQFEIADHRTVEQMTALIRSRGYDPVLSDWVPHDL